MSTAPSWEFSEDRALVRQAVANWETAIDLLGEILIAKGNASAEYIAAIKNSIKAPGGTYIDLGFGIALAHARPEAGVKSTGIAVLRLVEPVLLADDPAHPITVFIALAAQDSSTHLAVMQNLAQVLSDVPSRTQLLNATSAAEIMAALNKK
ncbi:PTS sugar transporter subunit IIA [Corynebacterium caspium]|uniref:PTS sugar transporter subunit IIA n=1 Tax=Corynebacterium caspium TaxID=234828 RepID=UPI00146156A7|nr:PTS sugar transporter subunit IIA [Corynebacterium caspium]